MAPGSSPRKLQEWEDCFTTVDPHRAGLQPAAVCRAIFGPSRRILLSHAPPFFLSHSVHLKRSRNSVVPFASELRASFRSVDWVRAEAKLSERDERQSKEQR
jgi:hypothetical protein